MDSAACSHQIDPKCHGLGSCRLFYIRHRYDTSSIEYKPINKLNANYSLRFPTLIHHLTLSLFSFLCVYKISCENKLQLMMAVK